MRTSESANVERRSEQAGELRLFRAVCWAAMLVYPAWGLFCSVLVPGSVNLLGQRLAISLVWSCFLLASYRVRGFVRVMPVLSLAGMALITGHYGYLVHANQYDPFYVAGVFVTLGAVDVLFGSVPAFVAYSVFAVGGSVALLAAAPSSSLIGPLLVVGVTSQQVLFWIGLRSRVALNDRLREMNRLVQQQNEQLRALDKLKDDFVKSVSHELRSPLTAVQGYGQLLRDGAAGALEDEQNRFVDIILSSATQLEGLVGDLLDHARIEAGTFKLNPAEVDLNEVVDGALVSLMPQAIVKDITLRRSLPRERIPMFIDRTRIAQVLTNLLSNAIKFTPVGGTVEVSAKVRDDEVRVEVRDTGRGIPSAALEHVFDRFYQVGSAPRDAQVGLGLGLAIAKAIVEGHGGHIGVVSQTGIGSTFWITCPARRPELQPA